MLISYLIFGIKVLNNLCFVTKQRLPLIYHVAPCLENHTKHFTDTELSANMGLSILLQ